MAFVKGFKPFMSKGVAVKVDGSRNAKLLQRANFSSDLVWIETHDGFLEVVRADRLSTLEG